MREDDIYSIAAKINRLAANYRYRLAWMNLQKEFWLDLNFLPCGMKFDVAPQSQLNAIGTDPFGLGIKQDRSDQFLYVRVRYDARHVKTQARPRYCLFLVHVGSTI